MNQVLQTKTVTFVTSNKGKFAEVQRYLKEFDASIILEQAELELPELQSLDIHAIALGKAKKAYKILKKPLLIDDGGIYLERYNNFPGPLVKYVFQGIGLEGFWLLAKDDPRVYFLSCLVYYYGPNQYQIFEGTCHGTVIKPTGKILESSLPFTSIFIPQGSTKSLAEIRNTPEERACHHRRKALEKFVTWLNSSVKYL